MIFVVEDDHATRDSLCLLLECEGFACRGFASSEAFLAANTPLDGGCLILDVHMDGMTGLDLLEQLRAAGKRVPAVVVTGQPSPATLKRATAAGAVAVLEKPFDSGALIDHVRALLDRAGR
jgi:FixJ family two-component response regulator